MPDSKFARQPGDLIAGGTLIGATLLVVFAMAHHPTGVHGGGGGRGDIVHGSMLVLLSALAFGFAHFALRRGFRRPLILAGAIAYLFSFVSHLGAATISGFVVPAMAASESLQQGDNWFALTYAANQSLARLGVYATGAAYTLWAIDVARCTGIGHRITGAVGIIAGVVPVIALMGLGMSMNISTSMWVYALHMLFALAVGVLLVRGRMRW